MHARPPRLTPGILTITMLVVQLGLAGLGAEVDRAPQGRQGTVSNHDHVKIAAVQISGYDKGDLPRAGHDAADALLPYIQRAGMDGAQLVVFPEYILGHISIPSPTTGKISRAAAAQRIYVIVGCWETYADATFANTALIFDRQGRIHGRYHKTHAAVDTFEGTPAWAKPPSGKSREWFLQNDPEWIMQRGTNLPVFEFDFGQVGILTCYDGWFPEPFRVLSLKGAELIVWINGRAGSVEDFIMQTVMFQNHVAMTCVNQAYGGGTMIGDPAGWPPRILARCPDKQESYITATIDLGVVRKLRGSSRNLQQRRPSLYGELVKPLDTDAQPTAAGPSK